jgi:hypothetical protein
LHGVFRRRAQQAVLEPAPETESPPVDTAPDEADEASEPSDYEELERVVARFALPPWDHDATPVSGPALAAALWQADPLWAAPRAGEVQRGLDAICGGHPPAALIGVQLWPTLLESASGPALVRADVRHRVHVVVDIPLAPTGRPRRPGWVAAASITHSARMPGSHPLWRHWQIELSDHAPHDWGAACADHTHLARPNAQGHLITGVPQHDAWMMSRSWLSPELALPSVPDVRWIVLGPTRRPLRERDPLIRGQWDTVSFGEFASAVAGQPDADAPQLPASVGTVLRMMLPA